MSEPVSAPIVVLEPNRRIGQRIARIINTAVGIGEVAYLERPEDLAELIGPSTRLLACGENDVEAVADRFCGKFPELSLLAWTTEAPARVLGLAERELSLSNVLGWPSFQSMPRPWELAMAARRICDPLAPAPTLRDLMPWGSAEYSWQPATTIDRDMVVAEVSQLALQIGAPARAADRVAEIAHELLMNAMYVAPIDGRGQSRYAYDRTQDLVLGEDERPALRLVTNGMLFGLEVVDRFGGLNRNHVFYGVVRGLGALGADCITDIVDSSHGGAGLGMARLYSGSSIFICDVAPGVSTRVISVHELDISQREMRSLPGSLHYFIERASPSP